MSVVMSSSNISPESSDENVLEKTVPFLNLTSQLQNILNDNVVRGHYSLG